MAKAAAKKRKKSLGIDSFFIGELFFGESLLILGELFFGGPKVFQ
jgi:hypothetical protein